MLPLCFQNDFLNFSDLLDFAFTLFLSSSLWGSKLQWELSNVSDHYHSKNAKFYWVPFGKDRGFPTGCAPGQCQPIPTRGGPAAVVRLQMVTPHIWVRLLSLNSPADVYGQFSEVMLSVGVWHKGFYWRASGMDMLLMRDEAISKWLGSRQMSANKINYTSTVLYSIYSLCDGKNI